MTAAPDRARDRTAFLLFLLLPVVLLGECLFGGRKYLSFDVAEFPPIGSTLTAEQRQELRATANYDATEAPIWFASELQLAREAVGRGQLPHWNGYVRGGAPMLAHGHLALLNPLHWPALLFPDPADGLLYLTWLMFALAGALMFGLLRALGLARPAAVLGGLAFAWSGTLAANGHWFMRMEPIALLPGMLWAMLAIARRSGPARALPAAGLALAVGGTWLSGFPQYGIPATLLAAGFGVVLCWREARAGWRSALPLAGWLALGAGIGFLLAMPSLLQMMNFYPLSNRPIDETLDRASRHAWAPMGFLGYVFPELFSHPGDVTLPQDRAPLPYLWSGLKHWETGEPLLPNYNFTEYAVFPGTLPLVFAALALLLKAPRWRWLLVGALAAVWLLATGAFGAHFAFLLPGIKTVPPYRFAGVGCALVAMLAALGLDALQRDGPPWLLRGLAIVLAAAGIVCVAGSTHAVPGPTTVDDPWLARIVERQGEAYSKANGIPRAVVTPEAALTTLFTGNDPEDETKKHDSIRIGRERLHRNLARSGIALLLAGVFVGALSFRGRGKALPGWVTLLAIAATAGELGAYSWSLNRGQPMPHPHDSAVHQFLRAQRDAHADRGGFLVARGAGLFGPWNLPGGTLAAEHIRDLNFYTFVDNKSDLPIRRLYGDAQILRGFVCNALPDTEALALPWWDLMGLRFVLATQPMQHAGARVGPQQLGNGADYFVYERPNAMPRAWVVPKLQVVDDETKLIDALVSKNLDPRAQVFVSSADAERLGPAGDGAPQPPRSIRFVHEDGKRLALEVGAGAPGYLVLADTFFPGWEATIGGQPVPIARGNLYQRVLALPAGACEVHFRFQARGFATGTALGAVACMLLLALLIVARRAPSPAIGHAPPAESLSPSA